MTSRTNSSLPRPRTKSAVVPPTFTPSAPTSPAFRPTLPSALLASHNASSKFTQLSPSLTFSTSNSSPSNTTSSTSTERNDSGGGSKLRKPSSAARNREKASTKKGEEEQRPLQKQISAPLFRPRGPSFDGAGETTRSGNVSKPGDSQQGDTSRLSSVRRRPVPSLIDENENVTSSTGDAATSPLPSIHSTPSPRPRTISGPGTLMQAPTSSPARTSMIRPRLFITDIASTEAYIEDIFGSSTNRSSIHPVGNGKFFNATSCEAAYTFHDNEDQYPQNVSCALNGRFPYLDGLVFLYLITFTVGSFPETTTQVVSTTLYPPSHTVFERCWHFAVSLPFDFCLTSGTIINFGSISSFYTFSTEIEPAWRTFNIGQAGIHESDFHQCWFVSSFDLEETYTAFVTTRCSGTKDTWTTATLDGEQSRRCTYVNSPKAFLQPEQLYGVQCYVYGHGFDTCKEDTSTFDGAFYLFAGGSSAHLCFDIFLAASPDEAEVYLVAPYAETTATFDSFGTSYSTYDRDYETSQETQFDTFDILCA
ncbi:hypothetical protein PQX77_016764 [Marasmius sp. AFHP31]|nr:hypothetical protein PQX77_016764 [Marasmius sp. AFHP31]